MGRYGKELVGMVKSWSVKGSVGRKGEGGCNNLQFVWSADCEAAFENVKLLLEHGARPGCASA